MIEKKRHERWDQSSPRQSFYCVSTVEGNESLVCACFRDPESGLLVLRCDCVKEIPGKVIGLVQWNDFCSLFRDFVTKGVL